MFIYFRRECCEGFVCMYCNVGVDDTPQKLVDGLIVVVVIVIAL
jgi:hypothetical protein